jgi:hypothetical protein
LEFSKEKMDYWFGDGFYEKVQAFQNKFYEE